MNGYRLKTAAFFSRSNALAGLQGISGYFLLLKIFSISGCYGDDPFYSSSSAELGLSGSDFKETKWGGSSTSIGPKSSSFATVGPTISTFMLDYGLYFEFSGSWS